ncbi:MAG TPA: hypothetical protein VGO78_19720, partial [Acidimicrobiales bacterium]|nr:hypothetical protein [Acidimicrobiales bacterium]
THAYLAPECFDTGPVGPATDLWALGATLFHAAAGRPPFERDTTTATLRAILLEEPPPPPCGPPLATAITGLLTRAVDQRLTGNAARQLLQQAVSTMPTVQAPPTIDPGSQSAWQAQPTTHHHPPTPLPGQTTQPGGPPSPFVTAQHPLPPQGPQGPGPTYAPSPGGPAPRNNAPLIFGVLAAVAAVVLIVVLASSGGGDNDNDGQEAGGNGAPTDLSLPPAGATDTTTVSGPTTTNSQGCCDGGAGAEAVAQDLLTAVNDGDETAAKAMLCDPADGDAFEISDSITRGASLNVDPTTIDTGGGNQYSASLLGVIDDEPITTGYVSAFPKTSEDGWCVDSFFVG